MIGNDWIPSFAGMTPKASAMVRGLLAEGGAMKAVDDWFQIREVEEGIFVLREREHVQSYLVKGEERAALVDTGMGFRDISEVATHLTPTPIIALNTHWHFDHIGGNVLFEQIGISSLEAPFIRKSIPNHVLMERYVRPFMEEGVTFPNDFVPETYEILGSSATFLLEDGKLLELGGRCLEILATPGHTRGSMSFLDSRTGSLLSGDFLYPGTIYAHFDESDLDQYAASLARIQERGDVIRRIYGGHNEPEIPSGYVSNLLMGLECIREGARPLEVLNDWGERVHLHAFKGIRILTKAPGSRGVSLSNQMFG
jgi:glyoxylase-like metal-dependent hydrolase (beta-lactamase superfamily II)